MADADASETVGELGEFALIDRMTRGRTHRAETLIGPGDDAAVVAAPDGRVVVTTDMLMQDSHFRLDWSSPRDIGRKAIAQNGADIAAMGARCTGFLVALACPPETSLAFVADLNEGLWVEAQRAGASVVGGDMVRGPTLVISITALGDLENRQPVLRSGAQVGDVVAVRGSLGRSAAGLALLERDGAAAQERWPALISAHRVPNPDYSAGPTAARGGATSMIDTSDGLLADLSHVARASGVRLDLDPAALEPAALEPAALDPGSPDLAADLVRAGQYLGVDPSEWVRTGGEDHALVATFPTSETPPGWLTIGTVQPRTSDLVTISGSPVIGRAGWTSF